MKRKILWIVAAVLIISMVSSFSLIGCQESAESTDVAAEKTSEETTESDDFTIGFIAMNQTMEWMVWALKAAEAAAEEEGIEMIVYDAENKVDKQGSLMENLIAQDVDAIITDPISVESLNPFLVEAEEAGIPVGTFDRRCEGAPYFAFVGSDDVNGARLAAQYISEQLNGEGKIIQIVGQLGSGPAIDRTEGFEGELENHPGLEIVYSQTGKFEYEEGMKVMEDAITTTGGEFDAVFAQSDNMMLGALQAMQDSGINLDDIVKVSYNGLPDELNEIRKGNIDATIQYPLGQASKIVHVMADYLKNGTVPEEKDMIVDQWLITEDNLESGDFYQAMVEKHGE